MISHGSSIYFHEESANVVGNVMAEFNNSHATVQPRTQKWRHNQYAYCNIEDCTCGMCNQSDNMCTDVSKFVSLETIKSRNASNQRGYYDITTIPKGATNIKIQHSFTRSFPTRDKSDTFLALSNYNNQNILNGNARLSPNQTNIIYSGVEFHYTGYSNEDDRSMWSFDKAANITSLSTKCLEQELIVRVNHTPLSEEIS